MLRSPRPAAAAAVAVALANGMANPAIAQTPPDYGFQWATITHPGNRATTPAETPADPNIPMGRVDHEYRIARTEVTVGQWLEFVNAYWPHFQGSRLDSNFIGLWIHPTSLDPTQDPGYVIAPGAANYPADMSWRMAARYCNWLTNNKATNAAAFENGAYDASTFTTEPNGFPNDQLAHNPGATFWIPTQDELVKAAYFDPNRYGQGQPGYWLYPNASNTALIPGLPSEGGQTTAGINGLIAYPVGQFPQVQSYWGLLDCSGGLSEYTETTYSPDTGRSRNAKGSRTGDPYWTFNDRIDFYSVGGGSGLRVASSVPSAASTALLVMLALTRCKRQAREIVHC